jgi:hypothetical protein
VYARVVAEFQHPATVSEHTIREALLWKWGHLGKSRIPATHTNLIALAASCWPQITATPLSSPRASFDRLRGAIGTGNRFITVAFLTHLLHPEAVPIIDQHNFRALNALLAMVRHDWPIKKRPSRYENIELLSDVMAAILRTWKRRAPRSIPTRSQLDRFLMMYGKSLKRTQRRTEGTNGD